jgi:DNA-binding NarL/FixJ family response regulator
MTADSKALASGGGSQRGFTGGPHRRTEAGEREKPVSGSPLRVVIAEDEFLVREGLRRALEETQGVEVVGATADLDELRRAVEETDPDIVVTDIRLPPTHGDEGIRFAQELREHRPSTAVVVLSKHADPAYALTLFEGGASGRAYVLKERLADAAHLERVLRAVTSGESYVDTRVVERILGGPERQRAPLNSLSPREREVLERIAAGRSNQAIADELSVSTRAVERHVNAIFAKLRIPTSEKVSRRVLAVLTYLESGPPAAEDVTGG